MPSILFRADVRGSPALVTIALHGDVDVSAEAGLVAAYADATRTARSRSCSTSRMRATSTAPASRCSSGSSPTPVGTAGRCRSRSRPALPRDLPGHQAVRLRADLDDRRAWGRGARMTRELTTVEVRRVAAGRGLLDRDRGCRHVRLRGPAPRGRASARPATARRVVVLDFGRLAYMNSGGIGLLVTLLVRARREGRRLMAVGLSPHYRQILALTRLDERSRSMRPRPRPSPRRAPDRAHVVPRHRDAASAPGCGPGCWMSAARLRAPWRWEPSSSSGAPRTRSATGSSSAASSRSRAAGRPDRRHHHRQLVRRRGGRAVSRRCS